MQIAAPRGNVACGIIISRKTILDFAQFVCYSMGAGSGSTRYQIENVAHWPAEALTGPAPLAGGGVTEENGMDAKGLYEALQGLSHEYWEHPADYRQAYNADARSLELIQEAIDDACSDRNATIRLMTKSLVTILDDPNITLPPGVGGLLDVIISTGKRALDVEKEHELATQTEPDGRED